VLEDLDRDDIVERKLRLEVVKVRTDQIRRQMWVARLELCDGLLRDIESDQIQSRIDERDIVPSVAAADIQAPSPHDLRLIAKDVDDAPDERNGRLVAVSAAAIFVVPAA